MRRALWGLLVLLGACQHWAPADGQLPGRPDIDQLLLAAELLHHTRADSSLLLARRAYRLAEEYAYASGLAKSSHLMGKTLYQMGALSLATSQLNEALQRYETLDSSGAQTEVYLLLGKVHLRSENYPQTRKYLTHALNLASQLDQEVLLADVYGHLGHFFEKQQQYDSALHYQQLALDGYARLGNKNGLAEIHDNLGSIYEDLEQYDKAYGHFEMALLLNQSAGRVAEAVINTNNIGDVFRKQGDLRMALKYTTEALQQAEAAQLDYQVKSACRDLAKIYLAMGNTDRAYEYLERAYVITDDIFGKTIAEEIAQTESVYEAEQKDQRIRLLEQEQQMTRRVTMMLLAGGALLLLLGALVVYQQRSKNEKIQKLMATEAALTKSALEIAHLNEQRLQTELENQQLREYHLQQELEMKSRSLTQSALHMIQKNEFLSDLRNHLKSVKKGGTDQTEKKVKRLIRSIDLNFSLDDDWHEFETVFQQVHSDFYKKLKELYPELSPAEVRLCAMIRLNLHSKDMAAIMGISQDSLRIARYRLRKRLGLKKGANLYTFVINIG